MVSSGLERSQETPSLPTERLRARRNDRGGASRGIRAGPSSTSGAFTRSVSTAFARHVLRDPRFQISQRPHSAGASARHGEWVSSVSDRVSKPLGVRGEQLVVQPRYRQLGLIASDVSESTTSVSSPTGTSGSSNCGRRNVASSIELLGGLDERVDVAIEGLLVDAREAALDGPALKDDAGGSAKDGVDVVRPGWGLSPPAQPGAARRTMMTPPARTVRITRVLPRLPFRAESLDKQQSR